jgi:hypothetical protein
MTNQRFSRERLGEAIKTPLLEFTILHEGWETDNTGWIVEIDGERVFVSTSHTGLYEFPTEELVGKINEYEQIVLVSKKALKLLQKKGVAF